MPINNQTWGQIHLYLKVLKYILKGICNCILFDFYELNVFVFKYFPKVFDVCKYFQMLFFNTLRESTLT